jgi:hypothetical protein
MRCAICGHTIQLAVEPIVSTTIGELVHVSCADRDAQRAYRWRTWRAAASAGIAIGLLVLAVRIENSDVFLLALLLLLAVAHARLNERWWRLTILPRRRRWR